MVPSIRLRIATTSAWNHLMAVIRTAHVKTLVAERVRVPLLVCVRVFKATSEKFATKQLFAPALLAQVMSASMQQLLAIVRTTSYLRTPSIVRTDVLWAGVFATLQNASMAIV
jgi:hypothetical protein